MADDEPVVGMNVRLAANKPEVREVYRTIRVKETGDVNLSTLFSIFTIGGLGLLALM